MTTHPTVAVIGDHPNSSMPTHEAPPTSLPGDATISARAAEPPLPGCPGVPPTRDHFPRRRFTAPLPGSPTMAAAVAQIAGLS